MMVGLVVLATVWLQAQDALQIDNKGNVGIGTKSPSALLQVGSGTSNNFEEKTTVGVVQRSSDTVGVSIRTLETKKKPEDPPTMIPTLQFCNVDSCDYIKLLTDGSLQTGQPLQIGDADDEGDKISLWGESGNHYGFGIQSKLLQIYTLSKDDSVVFGWGQSDLKAEHPENAETKENYFHETMRIQGNGNVGIGTTDPSAPLVVQGTDNNSLKLVQINNTNTGINAQAGLQMRTGNNAKFTGYLFQQNADLWLWNCATDDSKKQGKILFATKNDGTRPMVFDQDGNLSVPGTLKVALGGNEYKTLTLTDSNSRDDGFWGLFKSDNRLKTDVRPISSPLQRVNMLNGITYRWNQSALDYFTRDIEQTISAGPDATPEANQKVWQRERTRRYKELSNTNVGVVAQEVEAVLPEAVTTDEAGYKQVAYHELIPLLIEAIKEEDKISKEQAQTMARQQSEIQRLAAANESAQQQLLELRELKQRLSQLESTVGTVTHTGLEAASDGRPLLPPIQ